ncbi:MAG: hypothetical protein ACLPWF_20750 [Bryobacteraceae bacterium]
MDLRHEIAKRVKTLPVEQQELVLRFVASLSVPETAGEPGSALLPFASSLDSVSARQMIQAIEEERERVDAGEC